MWSCCLSKMTGNSTCHPLRPLNSEKYNSYDDGGGGDDDDDDDDDDDSDDDGALILSGDGNRAMPHQSHQCHRTVLKGM